MKKTLFLSFLFFALLFSIELAFADTPTVVSFTASRTMATSNGPIGFSWAIQNGGAPSITFNCPSGVRLWKSDGTTAVPCNTAQTIGSSQGANVTYFSDAVDYIVTNTSGVAKALSATLTPIDTAGTTYPSLAQTTSFTVLTDPEPIFSFISTSASSSQTMSYQPVTFSWVARGVTGINFMMSCQDNVIATSSSYSSGAQFPCGQPIFLTDLGSTASMTFNLFNMGNSNADVRFTILPAMEFGIYDASHGKSVTITVKPYVPPSVSVVSFDMADKVNSGSPLPLSWNVSGADMVNLKISCDLSITVSLSGTTTPLGTCGGYVFPMPVSSVSSTTLIFSNSSNAIQPISISVVPSKGGGIYDSTNSKTKILVVYPRGTLVQNSATVQTITPPSGVGQGNNVVNPSSTTKYKFIRALSLGSRNEDVTNLQKFLKNYPDLYPEGLVTGYVGPATVRAVKRFQEKYKLAKAGDSGYGSVGPKTRAKLNEVQ